MNTVARAPGRFPQWGACIICILSALPLLAGCGLFDSLLGGGEADAGATAGDATTAGRDATTAAAPAEEPILPQVCAGESHSCALKPDGTVLCWGQNSDGQLGDGTGMDRSTPVPVVGVADATHIACGHHHSCARRRNGTVACWGQSTHGQLGTGSTAPVSRPVDVPEVDNAVELSAGRDFTCLRHADGLVSCFGRNNDGQLGNGTQIDSARAVAVMALRDARSIASGQGHSCAVRNTGQVACWGRDNSRQLGRGGSEFRSTSPVLATGIDGATVVAAGGNHSCALTSAGVSCWGQNNHGQCGNAQSGTGSVQAVAAAVSGLPAVNGLALGNQHSCAVLADGAMQCWGYNGSRQLGHGASGDQATPVAVQSLTGVTRAAAGYGHTCAVSSSGQVYCWGSAGRGQLGRGDRGQPTPQPLEGALADLSPAPSSIHSFTATPSPTIEIVPHAAFGTNHVCVIVGRGEVACFGQGGDGRLGQGSTRPLASDSGVRVAGITDAAQLSAYGGRTCARRATGQVACWGVGLPGIQGAAGAPTSRPVPVSDVDDAAEVAVGGGMVCVHHAAGTVSCWGANNSGQLGNGETGAGETPTAVLGLSDAAELAAGQATMCARRQDGTVSCWGSGYRGALGNGDDDPVRTPTQVPRLIGVTDIAGWSHTFCAVHGRGQVSCWGGNQHGQLGNGSAGREADANQPTLIRTLRGIARIGLGGETACAVDEAGNAQCWGANSFGQTGHNEADTDDVMAPWAVVRDLDPTVRSFGTYASLDCGLNFCCGVHRSGALSCQGSTPIRGGSGFVGITSRRTPVPVAVPGIRIARSTGGGATADSPPTTDPAPTPDAGQPLAVEPPAQPDAAPAPTKAPDAAAPPPPPPPTEAAPTKQRPTKRPVRPECRRVRYSNCRIIHDPYGRPLDVCDCSPTYCCPGGLLRR